MILPLQGYFLKQKTKSVFSYCFLFFEYRFAKYFKTENGTEFRTLHKAFAIRFDVMVTGKVSCLQTYY